MRRFALFALALTLGAPACDDDSPNSPTAGPVVFTAQMSAANEVTATGAPAPTGAESSATGTVTITFTVPRDGSGNPTGDGVWNVQAVVNGLTTPLRLAHIHNGPAGVNAGIFVNTGLTAANEISLPNGAGTVNFVDVGISQSQATAVMANPAGHYFNMHSALNPGGVVRGQLVRVR